MRVCSQIRLQQNMEKRVRDDLQANRIGGAAIHVSQQGKTLYEGCFGNASQGSLFRIASMTKPITAAAILLLAERGALRLEDPVIKYLPGFPVELQVWHLLSHISGLSQEYYVNNIKPEHRLDPELLTDFIGTVPFSHRPGTYPEYSPVAAYSLLTAIAERATQMDFPSFVEQQILGPCQMRDTTFFPAKSQWARLVPMHDLAGEGWTVPGCVFEHYPVTNPLGGAGLVSSLTDYKNFAQMLLDRGTFRGKQILSEASVQRMTTPQVSEAVQPGSVRWGCGVRVITGQNRLPVGAYGWSGAYGTHFWVDPQNRIVAIYMKNSRYDGGASAMTAAAFEEDVMASFDNQP